MLLELFYADAGDRCSKGRHLLLPDMRSQEQGLEKLISLCAFLLALQTASFFLVFTRVGHVKNSFHFLYLEGYLSFQIKTPAA